MDRLTDIKRDIKPFVDPGSDVLVDSDALMWEKDGRERAATLLQAPGLEGHRIQVDGATMSYQAFLASSHMADLDRLAEFMPKIMQSTPNYVSTRATSSEESITDIADQLVARLGSENLPSGSTRIVLVQGEAGSGKTVALKRMTLNRARGHLTDSTQPLFFYIDVQGRALARLDDAMARYLQDLRSRFSYGAVPSLVRNGLLIPVIDGFDELLGSGGYDEAFSSLASFIAQLDGRGAVIASARSAFFDYNSFRENAEKFSRDGALSYEVVSVQMEPWNDVEAEQLVREKATNVGKVLAQFRGLRTTMDDSNRQLLRKPFYVSQITNLLEDGIELASNEMILDKLVDTFLKREYAKLLNKDGQPLLTLEGHRRFLVSLSEEMWWTEARYLDVPTVRAWAEMIVEEFDVSEEDARQIITRVPTYAFLSTAGTTKTTVAFEHEVFYGYFLAEGLKRYIDEEPVELKRFLNRTLFDETLVEQTARWYGRDADACTKAVESVCGVLRRGLTEGIARQNAGQLVARLMRSSGGVRPGTHLQNLYFHQDDFGEVDLKDVVFSYCHLDSVDLTRMRMKRPRFVECMLQAPRVSLGGTRFDDADSELADMVRGIVIVEEGSEEGRRYYAPEHIAAVLRRLGMQWPEPEEDEEVYDEEDVRRIRLLERFLLKMERRYYVSKEDLERFPFSREGDWNAVYGLLQKHGVVREEIRQMSGRPKPLTRLTYPANVIREAEDTRDGRWPRLSSFWEELLAGTKGDG